MVSLACVSVLAESHKHVLFSFVSSRLFAIACIGGRGVVFGEGQHTGVFVAFSSRLFRVREIPCPALLPPLH